MVAVNNNNNLKTKSTDSSVRTQLIFNRSRKISEKLKIMTELNDELCFINLDYSYEHEEPVAINDDLKVCHNYILNVCENLFLNGDIFAAFEDLKMKFSDDYKRILVYVLIECSLNHKAKQRELISQILCMIRENGLMSMIEMTKSFHIILDQLYDLTIDFPNSEEYVGIFIARAIYDQVLAPSFISQEIKNTSNSIIRKTLRYAAYMCYQVATYFPMEKIWGEYSLQMTVDELLNEIKKLINESMNSGDFENMMLAIEEMQASQFHHALVEKVLFFLLENADLDENFYLKTKNFFKYVEETKSITVDQLEWGFKNIFDNMGDILLDIPHAKLIMERFYKETSAHLPKEINKNYKL